MNIHALLGRLRGEISRIEAKHQSPGSARPAAAEQRARTLGAPPSPSSVAGGRRIKSGAPPVADPPPATRFLGIDGRTPLEVWAEVRARLEWLVEYAEESATKARARSSEAGRDVTAAERTVEQLREDLRRHDAAKPAADGATS